MQLHSSEELKRLAVIESSRIDSFLSSRIADTQVFAGDPAVRSMDPEAIKQTIARMSKQWPMYQGFVITGPDGNSIVTNTGKSLKQGTNPAFQKAIKGETTVGEPFVSQLTGDLVVAVFTPVYDMDGKIRATASMSVTTKDIATMLSEAYMGDSGETYLIDAAGLPLTPSRFTDDLKNSGYIKTRFELEKPIDTEGARQALAGNTGVSSYKDYRGRNVVGAYAPLKNINWALLVEQDQVETFEGVTSLRSFVLLIAAVVFALSILASILVARSITQPVYRLTQATAALAAGDMNTRAPEGRDEMGELGRSFNRMAEQLSSQFDSEREQRQHLQSTVERYVTYLNEVGRGNLALRITVSPNGGGENDPLVVLGNHLNEMTGSLQVMIGQIKEAASDLSSTAAEILAATTQQASGATEQSAAISQTTTTVSEVKTIAEQSSHRAGEVTETAQQTVSISRSGQQAVQEMITSMNQIKQRVEGIAENILALSEQTQQIGDIISTVGEIAAQSNILALNAAVEAARAGENGKGFAVVASEVRSLAEQSRSATAQVRNILSEIQKATNVTVMATEEGTKGVERGVQLANQAQQSIDQLTNAISVSAESAMQMAAGSRQQVSGVDQVAMAMQNIHQATIQSLASTRQAERAAQDLNNLARRLSEIVDQYQS